MVMLLAKSYALLGRAISYNSSRAGGLLAVGRAWAFILASSKSTSVPSQQDHQSNKHACMQSKKIES